MSKENNYICPNCAAITGLPLCKDCGGRGGKVGGSIDSYTWHPCRRCNGTGVEPYGTDYNSIFPSGAITRKP